MKLGHLDPRPLLFRNGWAEVTFVFLILCAQFLTQAIFTIALSTGDTIFHSFMDRTGRELSYSQRTWYQVSVLLTCGAFILLGGRLGDLFGLKHLVVIGWLWVAFWSLLNGFLFYLKSFAFFIICRGFTGIGFGLNLPCGIGILGRVYPDGGRKRLIFGLLGACVPLGSCFGALLAAVFAKYVWWPWCFWILGISSFLFGIFSTIYVPDINNVKSWNEFKAIWPQFDWPGSLAAVGGLILIIFSILQAINEGWDSAYVIVCFILSVILIVIFVVIEGKIAKYPNIPRSIYCIKVTTVLFMMTLGWGSYGIFLYVFWRLMLGLREYNPVVAATAGFPLVIMGLIAALCTSYLSKRIRALYLMCGAGLCFAAASVMLAVTPVDQSYWRMTFGVQFLLAWATNMSFPAASILMSNFLPEEHQAIGGSLINATVIYANAFFFVLAGSVEQRIATLTGSMLKGFRAAMYFSTGIAGLGVFIGVLFIIFEQIEERSHVKVVTESLHEETKE